LSVEGWEGRVLDGMRLLGQMRLAGTAGSIGAADLQLNVMTEDQSTLLSRLGLLTSDRMMVGGRLTGDLRLATAGSSRPITLKGDLRSTDLILRSQKARSLTQTVAMQVDLEVNPERTLVDVRRLEVAGATDGIRSGTLAASGHWPLTVGQPGAMALSIKEWDSGPVMDFFGFLPGRVPGPLPVTAEMTVTQEPDGATLALRGSESVGPLRVTVSGRPSEPTTLRLKHDISRTGEEFRIAALTLTADRMAHHGDRVSLTGAIRTGRQPRLRLRGTAEALDTDWYAALAAPVAGAPAPATLGDPHTAGSAGFPLPLDLDVDVAIGTVLYDTLTIGPGRLLAIGDGRRAQVTLERTGLAGGTVQGTITVAMNKREPDIGWNMKGSGLDLATITEVWFRDPERRLTGRGAFTTAGKGRGTDQATWRQSLVGHAVFDVADGQFIRWRVLEFLADETRIDHFRSLGFETLHGELRLKDGWITLQDVRADGSLAGLEAEGKVALDGRLEIRVAPKVGPTLAPHVKIPCLDQLARTAEGFTVLPIAVTVKGTSERPSYGAALTAGSMVGRQAGAVVGTIADLLTGCRAGDAAQRMTKEAVDAVTGTAKGLLDDVLGRNRKP
ncbi:MAG: hypothetical protein ICV75_08895, partial [Nitrospiraceae bacterium]|nr:hypothetical protein [Nitrospiraceae bacterium]